MVHSSMVRKAEHYNFVISTDVTCRICRTFQEGFLSKRVLVFTDHQTSFYCSSSAWMEGLGNPDPNAAHQVDRDRFPVNLFESSTTYLTSPSWNWNHYASYLEKYSTRQITKEADTLDAFLGVRNHIRRSRPTTQLLRGLPFFKTSGDISKITRIDSFEELVTAALSWCTRVDERNLPRRQSTFPSWTWAGWSEGAEFWLRSIREPRHQTFLRHAQLESSSGEIVVSSTLYKDNIQHKLDTVTLIQFEAPMIPAASFSITEDQLDDSDSDISNAEGFNFRVAGRMLFRNKYAENYTYDQLIENVNKGIWSCFMLCAGRCSKEGPEEDYSKFVLVVRWEADQVTAERIGWFGIGSDPSAEAELGPLGEESWTWRRVRLI